MVSFIIPSYNRSHTVINSIESVINQTSQYWELIIVDDGSLDETREIIKPFLMDQRIRFFSQKNSGVATARNVGAKMANGDYLIFLDSDDILDEELLTFLEKISYEDFDLICWGVKKIVNEKTSYSKPKQLGYLYNYKTANFLAGSVCYKKEAFLKVGGYDSKLTFGENYELGIRICKLENLKIETTNQCFLTYFINTQNRTSNSNSNRLYSLFQQFRKHRSLYQSNRREHAKLYNILGYLLESSKKNIFARKCYLKAYYITPWNIKLLLKYCRVFLKN